MDDPDEEIAVIGIGCNFPGGMILLRLCKDLDIHSLSSFKLNWYRGVCISGEGLDNFWRVLLEGKNCAADIPAERFDTTFWFDADDCKPGKTQTTRAALIEG